MPSKGDKFYDFPIQQIAEILQQHPEQQNQTLYRNFEVGCPTIRAHACYMAGKLEGAKYKWTAGHGSKEAV